MSELAAIQDLEAGATYPGHLLDGCDTALVMFAAGFLGKQDAYWIADAGLKATCVDVDAAKLQQMQTMYPDAWHFVIQDAYDYAEHDAGRWTWDIVSLDPWTQDFDRCAAQIGTWCYLANRAVILGTGAATRVTPPKGWNITEIRKRSDYMGGVYWTCLEPY